MTARVAAEAEAVRRRMLAAARELKSFRSRGREADAADAAYSMEMRLRELGGHQNPTATSSETCQPARASMRVGSRRYPPVSVAKKPG